MGKRKNELEELFKSNLIEISTDSELDSGMLDSTDIPDAEESFQVPFRNSKVQQSTSPREGAIKLQNTPTGGGDGKLAENSTRMNDQKPFQINRFPGIVHIHINHLEHFISSQSSDTFSLRLEVSGQTYSTPRYVQSRPATIGYHLAIPVTESGIEIKVIVIQQRNNKAFKSKTLMPICEGCIVLSGKELEQCQNKFEQRKSSWVRWRYQSLFKRFKEFFLGRPVSVGALHFTITYLADDEVLMVNMPPPTNVKELEKWIFVCNEAQNLFFSGYLSISEKNKNPVHCYIKWYGYTLFLFSTNHELGLESINIVDAHVSYSIDDSSFKFVLDQGEYEFYCDTSEKYYVCVDAITSLFGKSCQRDIISTQPV